MATLRLGDTAPDFQQDSTAGPISFHAWAGDAWVVLISHPADFTPVCTTELGRTAALAGEFERRGVKPIAVSVDPLESHQQWVGDIEETQGAAVGFPILADGDRKVALLYDMIHPNSLVNATVRSVFIIDPKKVIRATFTYPASTGRNFAEILRVIDSLQLTDGHKVATPADWTNGDDVVILPSLQDPAELARRFPRGWRALRPYLRLTAQPGR
jgi:alkyl hydroperoxide reductase subunit AhpC